jgi:predicted RNase H-like HicB family nuclease
MKRERYHMSIFCSDEDEGFIADVPDLAHCSAFGETPEAALAEVRVATRNWLAAARNLRRPIPKPRYRPAICQTAP